MAAVERLLEQAEPHVTDGTLPYGEALMADLGGALEAARTEWSATQSAHAKLQADRAATRIAANRFLTDLQALRTMLRFSLGTERRKGTVLDSSIVCERPIIGKGKRHGAHVSCTST